MLDIRIIIDPSFGPRSGRYLDDYEVIIHDINSTQVERMKLNDLLYRMGNIGDPKQIEDYILKLLQSSDLREKDELCKRMEQKYKDRKLQMQSSVSFSPNPSADVYPRSYHESFDRRYYPSYPSSNAKAAVESIEKEKTLSKRDRDIYYLTS